MLYNNLDSDWWTDIRTGNASVELASEAPHHDGTG
jgi:hypothetical protein